MLNWFANEFVNKEKLLQTCLKQHNQIGPRRVPKTYDHVWGAYVKVPDYSVNPEPNLVIKSIPLETWTIDLEFREGFFTSGTRPIRTFLSNKITEYEENKATLFKEKNIPCLCCELEPWEWMLYEKTNTILGKPKTDMGTNVYNPTLVCYAAIIPDPRFEEFYPDASEISPSLRPMQYTEEKAAPEILGRGLYKGLRWCIISHGLYPTAYIEDRHNVTEKEFWDGDSQYNKIDVHGGWTYCDKAYWDMGDTCRYVGWDYRHLGDFIGNYPDDQIGKQWTVAEIFSEVAKTIEKVLEKSE